MSLKDLPSPNAPNFQLRVREMLHTILGKNGSVDDRLLTLREAIAAGVVKPGPGGALVPGDAIRGGTGGETYEPDLTPPPTPTGFSVDPAIGYVFIQHDAPLYLQGHGHLRTRVYGVTHLAGDPIPVFADAVEVGQFEGTVWAMPSNPATTWHLWAKWETRDGVLSVSPAGGTNGVVATTGQDVSLLLDALAGQIGTGQLATSLATRIDLIDGTGPGSVAQRIADEATARGSDILAERNARSTADTALQDQIDLLAEVAGGDFSSLLDAINQERTDRIADVLDAENAASTADGVLNSAIVAEALQRAGADTSLSATASAVAAATSGNAAAVVQEQAARTSADAAMAQASSTLAAATASNAASVRGVESAQATVNAAQAAAVQAVAASAADANAVARSEVATRADADAALAARSDTLAVQMAGNVAGLIQEASVRSDGDSAQASTLAATIAQAQGATAAVSNEQDIRAAADSAQAAQGAFLSAQIAQQAAAVMIEQTARVTDSAALAQQTATLVAQSGEQAAAVQSSSTASTSADAALAAQVQAVSAEVGGAEAAVRAEETVRVTADSAQASTSTVLASALAGNIAATVSEQQSRVTEDAALAQRSDVIAASFAAASAAIAQQALVQSTQDGSLATQINTVATSTANNASSIATLSQTVSDNYSASATASQTLFSKLNNGTINTGAFDNVSDWTSDLSGDPATRATATSISLTTDPDFGPCAEWNPINVGNRIMSKAVMRLLPGRVIRASVRFKVVDVPADGSSTFSIRRQYMFGNYASNGTSGNLASLTVTSSGIYEITGVISDTASSGISAWADGSDWVRFGIYLNTTEAVAIPVRLQYIRVEDISDVRELTAAIQTEAETRATQTGDLFAKYTVKVDVAGHVSGYGLASEANNGAVVSRFGIRADQFFVAPPATSSTTAPTTNLYKGRVWVDTSVTPNVTRYYTGSAWSTTPQALPFVVQATPTTIDGQEVPAGVYINGAYIQGATIDGASIKGGSIAGSKLIDVSANKITGAALLETSYIESYNYVSGSSGWRINGDGTAEFSGVVVRGTIFASQGAIGGWTIGSNYLQSTTYVLGESGTRLNSDGTGQIGGVYIGSDHLKSYTFDTPGAEFGFKLNYDGASEFKGAVIRSGSGRVLLTAVGDAVPPWVTTIQQANENGITLVSDPDPATNTARIKSLFAGYLTDIDTTDEAVTISSIPPSISVRVNQTQNSTTWADVQGVSWPVEGNSQYEFEAYVAVNRGSQNKTWEVGLLLPSTAVGSGGYQYPYYATAYSETRTPYMLTDSSNRLYATVPQGTSETGESGGYVVMRGFIYTSLPGVIQAQFRRSSGSTSNIIQRGSVFKLRKTNIAPELGALASPQTIPATASSTTTGTFSTTPGVKLVIKEDGTWLLSRNGASTLNGSWMQGAPLSSGQAQNYDVLFEVTPRVIGGSGPTANVKTSFTAGTWTQVTSDKKADVWMDVSSVAATAGTRTCTFTITTKVRQRSTQVVTTIGVTDCSLSGTTTSAWGAF